MKRSTLSRLDSSESGSDLELLILLATGTFLFLVVRPGAPSSVLVPCSMLNSMFLLSGAKWPYPRMSHGVAKNFGGKAFMVSDLSLVPSPVSAFHSPMQEKLGICWDVKKR